MCDNNIIKLFNFIDKDIIVTDVTITGNQRMIYLKKEYKIHYCPKCGQRLYVKDKRVRHVNHPVFQDGLSTTLMVEQKRFICKTPGCKHTEYEQYSFLDKHKRNTNLLPYMIFYAFRDINVTLKQLEERFNVSDTYIYNEFMLRCNFDRLPFTEAISVDEVNFGSKKKFKYALVIRNFNTAETSDILISRRKEITEPYFLEIPYNERCMVKYIISDMYSPFLNYPSLYFPNAISIVDSFHVIGWLNREIKNYIQVVLKKYRDRDKERLDEKNHDTNRSYETITESREVYVLRKFQFFLLSYRSEIDFTKEPKYNYKFQQYMSLGQLEEFFLSLDSNFRPIQNLKEFYYDFSRTEETDLDKIKEKLFYLINIYKNSSLNIFKKFAVLLEKYSTQIVNSFIRVECQITDRKTGEIKIVSRRLSNGPTESFNNIPKDFKRISNGVKNFEYGRNRVLLASRSTTSIQYVPKPKEYLKSFHGKKRGTYKKNNK